MDRDAIGPPRADRAADTCPPLSHLDVPAWGGTQPFAFELGHLNSTLFGEFDTVRTVEALRLARLYIHHGFGAEARQVLGWLDHAAPEAARAGDLARIVAGAALPAGSVLAGALGCGEPGVLWAILAMPELPQDAVFDHRALRRSFVALPGGLRRALGPALVQRLLVAGHRGTAEAMRCPMPKPGWRARRWPRKRARTRRPKRRCARSPEAMPNRPARRWPRPSNARSRGRHRWISTMRNWPARSHSSIAARRSGGGLRGPMSRRLPRPARLTTR
jgi:hypothetical protein